MTARTLDITLSTEDPDAAARAALSVARLMAYLPASCEVEYSVTDHRLALTISTPTDHPAVEQALTRSLADPALGAWHRA
ncbi:hypothetical protein [Streptomyces sp. NPDC047028]|uniref:hypothetical protein n=1 Tax=Streptomyces sp. NPDC047028 TaxID=3155793 RepID=UPI0033C1ECE8